MGVVLALLALGSGLELRQWLWKATTPTRFQFDIGNGFRQASRALTIAEELRRTAGAGETKQDERLPLLWTLRGVKETYDRVYAEGKAANRFSLDYTPARLAVMTLWLREARYREGQAGRPWPKRYLDEYVEPLLTFNTCMGALAAAAAFGMSRCWLRRQLADANGLRREWTWIGSLLVAMAVWFNPGLLLNAHAWPQWDLWLLPWFFLGVWAASNKHWATAGVMLGLAAMFKGQVLLTAPALVVWALIGGKGAGLGRFAAGFALGWAALVWPWLVTEVRGTLLVAAWVGLGITFGLGARRRERLTSIASGALLAGGLAVFIAGAKFHGSWSWYQVGFAFPTDHYLEMSLGPTSNLSAVLGRVYGWNINDPVEWAAVNGTAPTIRQLLRGVYLVASLFAGIMLARAAMRKDATGVFCSLTAAWAVAFAVLPQMHERYLIWAGVVSALCVSSSASGMVLHLITTALVTVMTYQQLLEVHPLYWPEMLRSLRRTCPHLGWVVLLVAGIWLWMSVGLGRRSSRQLTKQGASAKTTGHQAA